MKKFWIISAMLASYSFIAQAENGVDYSNCQKGFGFSGPIIQPDGSILPPFGMESDPDVKTIDGKDGQKEVIYQFNSKTAGFKGKPEKYQIKVKKDANGNIVSVSNVQEKMNDQRIKFHKEMMLQSAVYSGLPSNSQDFYPQPSFLSNPKIKELRKQYREKIKDTKSLNKIRDGYSRFIDKSDMVIPNGVNVEMEIVNGTCSLKNVQMFSYDVKTKNNFMTQGLNRELCRDEINRQKEVHKKYQKFQNQLSECREIEFKMNQELRGQPIPGGIVGGSSGGGVVLMGGPGIGGPGIGGPGFGPGIGGPGFGPGIGGLQYECMAYFGGDMQEEEKGYSTSGSNGGANGSSMGGETKATAQ